jgi:hypothetical protein
MKNLSEQVTNEFQSYQSLISEDEAVDYNILDSEEFFARQDEVDDECVPEETRHFEKLVESIPLRFLRPEFI